MALHVPRAPGFASMMKDGTKYLSGVEESVLRNIDACKELGASLASAFGPTGLNKIVINDLEKHFVTNDAATILHQLEVQHPAAKVIVMASDIMEKEVGDGTNLVMILAVALLTEAEGLIRMGMKPTEIADDYEQALNKALEILPSLVVDEVKVKSDLEQVSKVLRPAVMSKQFGNEDFLVKLIGETCVSILPDKETKGFSVDNIRICKIPGSSLYQSSRVHGMVFKRDVASVVVKQDSCKIVVYTCPVDQTQTETKGTVLIKTAEELTQFSQGEEAMLEERIKGIADAGVSVVISGGKIGDLALHFLNKYGLMAIRLTSKWDVRRVCKAVGATALAQLARPTSEQLGYADTVYLDEIGDCKVVVVKVFDPQMQKNSSPASSSVCKSPISTIVIRGATDQYMDDVERAIDDGINTFKALAKDDRLVAGGGACEMALSKQISSYAETCAGLEQYAIDKFAQALTAVARTLAKNSGARVRQAMAELKAAHAQDKKNACFNVHFEVNDAAVSEVGAKTVEYVADAVEKRIFDLWLIKFWALKYATSAACTVLRVDQIIMAKRAGGPKAPPTGHGPDHEDD